MVNITKHMLLATLLAAPVIATARRLEARTTSGSGRPASLSHEDPDWDWINKQLEGHIPSGGRSKRQRDPETDRVDLVNQYEGTLQQGSRLTPVAPVSSTQPHASKRLKMTWPQVQQWQNAQLYDLGIALAFNEATAHSSSSFSSPWPQSQPAATPLDQAAVSSTQPHASKRLKMTWPQVQQWQNAQLYDLGIALALNEATAHSSSSSSSSPWPQSQPAANPLDQAASHNHFNQQNPPQPLRRGRTARSWAQPSRHPLLPQTKPFQDPRVYLPDALIKLPPNCKKLPEVNEASQSKGFNDATQEAALGVDSEARRQRKNQRARERRAERKANMSSVGASTKGSILLVPDRRAEGGSSA